MVNPHIKALEPYRSARDEYSGIGTVWMDANENPYDRGFNRYPDPNQKALKHIIAQRKQLSIDQVFIGNGSDEAIDLLFRIFCCPKKDKAYVFQPTYGMYHVSAAINNIELVSLSLNEDFSLPTLEHIKTLVKGSGLVFICSPNNPTGNVYALENIKAIADYFNGIVVVDEAYIDFSETKSAIELIKNTPNLVVLQTLSKAYGLAGLRLGMAYGHQDIIDVLNKVKPPYNINAYSQKVGIEVLENNERISKEVKKIKTEREKLIAQLKPLPIVVNVYPSQANFILVRFKDSDHVYKTLIKKGIIVRNRNKVVKECLRITIGTEFQNRQLVNIIKTLG